MKVLITESTQVNHGDDRGGVHEEAGTIIEVNKENATKLTEAGRALFVNKSDDPFKDGRYTASKEFIAASVAMNRAKAAAQASAEKEPPAA